jgi:hypothetical protein
LRFGIRAPRAAVVTALAVVAASGLLALAPAVAAAMTPARMAAGARRSAACCDAPGSQSKLCCVAGEEGIGIDENAVGHIFKSEPGHLADDTPASRALLTGVANNPDTLLGTDQFGSDRYAEAQPNGTQVWARVQGIGIRSGGVNPSPGTWNPQTGLSWP